MKPASGTFKPSIREAIVSRTTAECTLGGGENASGGKLKSFSTAGIELSRGGKHTILTGSGRRYKAVRNFTLHHEHDGLKVSSVGEQAQQDVGSDEIGKIANHPRGLRLMIHSRTRASGLGSEDRVEIDGQNIALDDLDIRDERKLHAQLGRQHAVEFDSDEASSTPGEQGSQGAASGPDFEHRALREIAEGLRRCALRLPGRRENADPIWVFGEPDARQILSAH